MPLPAGSAMSPAVTSLGLGGAALADQVKTETDEERKRRMKEMQDQQLMPAGSSPATLALFGGSGGLGI